MQCYIISCNKNANPYPSKLGIKQFKTREMRQTKEIVYFHFKTLVSQQNFSYLKY